MYDVLDHSYGQVDVGRCFLARIRLILYRAIINVCVLCRIAPKMKAEGPMKRK